LQRPANYFSLGPKVPSREQEKGGGGGTGKSEKGGAGRDCLRGGCTLAKPRGPWNVERGEKTTTANHWGRKREGQKKKEKKKRPGTLFRSWCRGSMGV